MCAACEIEASAGMKWTMMRHGNRVKHLGRPADQRKALIRGLVTQVILHGQIKTTKVKLGACRAASVVAVAEQRRTRGVVVHGMAIRLTKSLDAARLWHQPAQVAVGKLFVCNAATLPEERGRAEN